EGLAVDLEAGEAPGAEGVGAETEGEQILEEPVLGLEVLGREQDALGPDHLLELLHALPWLRLGRLRPSTALSRTKWTPQRRRARELAARRAEAARKRLTPGACRRKVCAVGASHTMSSRPVSAAGLQ